MASSCVKVYANDSRFCIFFLIFVFEQSTLYANDIYRKHGPIRDVEEAQEVNEEVQEELQTRQRRTRNIHATVFENNFNVEPVISPVDAQHQNSIVGFSQCLMYLCEYDNNL